MTIKAVLLFQWFLIKKGVIVLEITFISSNRTWKVKNFPAVPRIGDKVMWHCDIGVVTKVLFDIEDMGVEIRVYLDD